MRALAAALIALGTTTGAAMAQDDTVLRCQMVDPDRNVVLMEVRSTGGLRAVLKFDTPNQTYAAVIRVDQTEVPGGALILGEPGPDGDIWLGAMRADGGLRMFHASPAAANRTAFEGNCDGHTDALAQWSTPPE